MAKFLYNQQHCCPNNTRRISPSSTNSITTNAISISSNMRSAPSSNAALPPVSIGASITSTTIAAPYSSSSGLNVLPITAVVSNGQTASFSEDQDPSLATLSGTTSVPITLTASESGKLTMGVVPVIVGVGGFCWRPLSLPGLTFPKIQLPQPPPIPKFPCFKLFDIFSIDCPPSGSSSGSNNNPPETATQHQAK